MLDWKLRNMHKIVIKILVNIAALWVADWALAGFAVGQGWKGYVLAGAVLGLLNLLAKPILKLIAMPLIILTLGLFTLVINGLLLGVTGYIFDFVTFSGIMPFVWTTLIVTAANIVLRSR